MELNRREFVSSAGMLAAIVPMLGLAGHGARAQANADASELAKPPAIGDMILGKDDAPVTIIEYASATCPHCARFHTDTFGELKKQYIDTGKVRFIFREFPFDDLAFAAFMLARCAPKEKYFPMIDVLFAKQRVWTRNNPRDELFKIAKLAGFTEDSFNACLKNEKIARGIHEIRKRANEKFGVNSTPTFFINGKVLPGNQPLQKFDEMIKAETG